MQILLVNSFILLDKYFLSKTLHSSEKIEKELYINISKISMNLEKMRNIGLLGSDITRAYSFFAQYIRAFENLKHIFQYSTPKILKKYSQIFTYTIPIIYAPYFAYISQENPVI